MSRQIQKIKSKDLEILEFLDSGGFGTVFKAKHSDWGDVVYKKLHFTKVSDYERGLISTEAEIHDRLNHPNIVKFLGLVSEDADGQQPGIYGLVLEHVVHGGMDCYLSENKTDWKRKLCMVHDVALGMSYLHSHSPPIIHGDLKMVNVLVDENLNAKICDFGFSRCKEFSTSVSQNVVRWGTITHIPPENWENANLRKAEPFDIYGFGIFVWEVMTELKPFHGQNNPNIITVWVQKGQRPALDEIPDDVHESSRVIVDLVQRCWCQEKDRRPGFSEIKKILEEDRIIANKLNISNPSIADRADFDTPFNNFLSELQFDELESSLATAVYQGKLLTPGSCTAVRGIASVQGKIYVVCRNSNKIYCFSGDKSFTFQRKIAIPEMKMPFDIAGCEQNACLYVTGSCESKDPRLVSLKFVWEVSSLDRKAKPVRWSDQTKMPHTITVTPESKVLWSVSLTHNEKPSRLEIYDAGSEHCFNIDLPKSTVPSHAVKFINETYLVCDQGTPTKRLILVSKDGVVMKKYPPSRLVQSLNNPEHIAVDRYRGGIFVADKNEVLLFDSELKLVKKLLQIKPRELITKPTRLLYREKERQLLVGQESGTVLVFSI